MKIRDVARAGCAAFVLSAAAAVQAAPVTYTIGGVNSKVHVTGSVAGETIGGQTSDVSISNQVQADRTNNTVKFLGGSSGIVANRSGTYSPGVGGDPFAPNAAANFAFTTSSLQGAAVRDLRFHPVSTTAATIGGTGSFATNSFDIAIDSGTIDFVRSDFQYDSVDISGLTFNASTIQPTITQSGTVETLTLPFEFTVPFSVITSGDSSLTFTGEMDATRTVAATPEPGSLMLLPVAAGMLLRRRRA